MTSSKHYKEDREKREALIKEIGYGKTIKIVVIDKGHKNGAEIHAISNTGIITIYNKETGKLITKLIAKPVQIRRYYKNEDHIPAEVIKIAEEHHKKHYNLV